MKTFEKITAKIESLDDIYSERIRKLRERNNAKAEFKLGKIESMAKRGRNISSASKRLQKFIDDWESRESHHLKMKADRVAKLKEKRQSFIYKTLEKKLQSYQRKKIRREYQQRRRQEIRNRRQEIQRLRNELIEAERGGWRGRRYQRERNNLIWNLYRRRRGRIGRQAYGGLAIDYFIDNNDDTTDVIDFLESCRQETLRIIVPRHVPSKTQLKLECIFARKLQDGSEEEEQKIISTRMFLVPHGSDFVSEWNYCVDDLTRKLHNFMGERSGWRLKEIIRLIIAANHYNPERGGTFLEIPKEMAAKKALINIKNEDNECFKWAITRSLFKPTTFLKNPGKVSKELMENSKKLNWDGITFPSGRKDFNIFERKNPGIGLIVYAKEGKDYLPVYITKKEDCKKAYIFFYKNHYLTITSLSRLVNKSTTSKHKEHICERCARNFSRESALKNHEAYCKNFNYAKLNFPIEEPFIKFKNYRRKQKNFLKIYADFECYQKKESILRGKKSTLITKHIPCAWGIYECRLDGKNKYHEYVGENAEEKFIEKLNEIAYKFYWEFKWRKPLDLKGVKESNECWICNEKFKGEIPVNDHCHFTGKFRGKAHSKCNLLLHRNLDFIPVFIHNLAGYDEKLFLRKLGNKTKVIGKNDENFISFSNSIKVDEYFDKNNKLQEKLMEIRFLDSFKFMSGSLDNLAKNLKPEQFLNTNKYFEKPEKGYYPYEYLDSLEKLEETSLPSHEKFYSILRGENIGEKEYDLAKKAWEKYGCKTLKDYTKIYMKMDVLLLSDIMENFIKTCLEFYELDPTWYFTVPGFAWDCCLKFTGQTLELFTEKEGDMLLFFESGIRGGISSITKRYAKANNPYMKNYDPKKPTSYILYLDANNLYGWAMSKKLPVGNFKWMNEWELKHWNSDKWGCVLEVDLEYPQKLHNLHNDLPLAPERMEGKLIPNLKNKEKYILHRDMLKTCLDLGLKLTKIHRGIRFEEKTWLKPYIDFNTEKRAKSKNAFEKDFFKLMNNAVFGKTMENLRNRVDIRIASKDEFPSYVRKVNFERRTILTKDKSLVRLRKLSIKMNKPLYVGMCILDISKILMYKFHYNEILEKQFPNAELLFTDTDSLCYEIHADDVYKTMAENVNEWYDTSGYKPMKTLDGKDFPHGRNKKIIGYMKDEENGNIITHFGGVRSKCYAYKTEEECVKKAKGIKKNVIKKGITFEDYERCIFEKKTLEVEIVGFRSLKHEMYTEKIRKKALEYTDTERQVLKDGIHTKAWGYIK